MVKIVKYEVKHHGLPVEIGGAEGLVKILHTYFDKHEKVHYDIDYAHEAERNFVKYYVTGNGNYEPLVLDTLKDIYGPGVKQK